jgi:membrane-associated phospholipid phosphatase
MPRDSVAGAVLDITRFTLLDELTTLDNAVYGAIAQTPTPTLDRALRRLSGAADHSKLWLATAAGLALAGGPEGRRAAVNGLASVGLTSAVVNVAMKPLHRRRRPDRVTHNVPVGRHVTMPLSHSFPSGHAASAFAFANGVASVMPQAGIPLGGMATAVAYSRVHTGVHFPLDVVVGSVTGAALSPLATTLPWLPRSRATRVPLPTASLDRRCRRRSSGRGRQRLRAGRS